MSLWCPPLIRSLAIYHPNVGSRLNNADHTQGPHTSTKMEQLNTDPSKFESVLFFYSPKYVQEREFEVNTLGKANLGRVGILVSSGFGHHRFLVKVQNMQTSDFHNMTINDEVIGSRVSITHKLLVEWLWGFIFIFIFFPWVWAHPHPQTVIFWVFTRGASWLLLKRRRKKWM